MNDSLEQPNAQKHVDSYDTNHTVDPVAIPLQNDRLKREISRLQSQLEIAVEGLEDIDETIDTSSYRLKQIARETLAKLKEPQ